MRLFDLITYTVGTDQFNYRVAAVCIQDQCLLLHRGADQDFWSLPGGRPEFGEISSAALAREMREELGLEIRVGRLLWLIETFLGGSNRRVHELGLYFDVTLPPEAYPAIPDQEYRGIEPDEPLIFRWFPIDQLAQVRFFPLILRTAMANLPSTPVRMVYVDVSG